VAPTVPFGPPTVVRSGDTWAFTYSHPDFPVADGWVLSAALVSATSASQAPLTWDTDYVTDDGEEWTVTLPAEDTDAFGAGSYRLTLFATLAGARYSPYSGPLLVEPNAAALTAGQGRTHAEEMWQAIKDTLEGRAVADVESYQINGRALNRVSMEDLQKLEKRYAERVWRERNPGKSLPGARVAFWSGA
jgi:hypothetical protein